MTKLVYPKVSFIIPTLNAGDIILHCLTAIRSQKYPQHKVEIIVADGGSTDDTLRIAKKFGAKIIENPEILHEQGKDRGSQVATGEILFYTDADNILQHSRWLEQMIIASNTEPDAMGFLPQTIPAPDSNSLDRYLGYLSTDPFTWFIYNNAASPRDYKKIYNPIRATDLYELYRFTPEKHPLIGLTQGFGTKNNFRRGVRGHADDILSTIKLIEEGGLIVYIPSAGIYHYHISSLANFINKYRWRVRNNLNQTISGMGLVNRLKYYNFKRKLRMYIFLFYALTIFGPLIDTAKLLLKHKDLVMLWHPIATYIIAIIIIWEYIEHIFLKQKRIGTYE